MRRLQGQLALQYWLEQEEQVDCQQFRMALLRCRWKHCQIPMSRCRANPTVIPRFNLQAGRALAEFMHYANVSYRKSDSPNHKDAELIARAMTAVAFSQWQAAQRSQGTNFAQSSPIKNISLLQNFIFATGNGI
jgi:hypothetical protein